MNPVKKLVSARITPAQKRRRNAIVVVSLAMGAAMLSSTIGHTAGVQVIKVQTGDANANGHLDYILATFNTTITGNPEAAGGPGQPGWTVQGYQITSFNFQNSNTQLKISIAEVPEYDTGVRPPVTYVQDGLVSPLTIKPDPFSNRLPDDAAGPVVVRFDVSDVAQIPQNAGLFKDREGTNQKGDEVWITLSEPSKLLGATATDRWSNLDKAIQFNTEGGCALVGGSEGNGTSQVFTFPAPAANGTDPIDVPADAQTAASVFHVKFPTGASAPNQKFPGVPDRCWIGIDPDPGMNAGIVDTAQVANPGAPQNATALKVYPNPIDAGLLSAATSDVDADGDLDALKLTFDQKIESASVHDQLPNIQISLGGVIANVDTSATDTGDDFFVTVPFTLPGSAVWGTGVRPNVTYVKPSGCSSSVPTSSGIKAIVPMGGSWRTCVGSFNVQAVDGAGPALLNALTQDADGDGKLDKVRAIFSEDIVAFHTNGWTLNGQAANSFVLTSDPKKADIGFIEPATPDTAATPTIAYATQALNNATTDANGAQVGAATKPTIDGAAPAITGATVRDVDADGHIDHAILTYSEAIVDPSSASDFTVGGATATGFEPGSGDEADDATLTLAVDVDGTEAKDVSFNGTSVADAIGNASGQQTVAAAQVIDDARPKGVISISPSAPLGEGESTITVDFSEVMNTAVAPTVTLGTKTVNAISAGHTNGFSDADKSLWEGTVAIVAGDCAVSTGCPVTASINGAKDKAGLDQLAASKATEIDTVAPQAPVVGAFSATFATGEGAPSNTINMFTKSIGLGGTVLPGDAEAGVARLLVDGNVVGGSADGDIAGSDATISPTREFADLADLTTALPEGDHQLSIRLFDDAGNFADAVDSVLVHIDYTAVTVGLTEPNGGNVVGGGSTLQIAWNADETAADFDRVDLEWSKNGASFNDGIVSGQPADGTYDWTVPSVDIANAKVRATSVDTSGNKAYGVVGEVFSIDSTAPAVDVLAPKGEDAFLPAGGHATIRWDVTDASVHRVTDPISILYSVNNGATWLPINGGGYSHANDGQEVWNVPGGLGLAMKVKVTAVDATDKTGSDTSVRLARGVAGYVAGSNGAVTSFGSVAGSIDESRTKAGDWVRGMAVRGDGKSGFVLGQDGKLYPFAVGGASMPNQPKTTALKGDSARGVALRTNKSGYVVDKFGGVRPFGGAPKAHASKQFTCDCARGIVLLDSGKGGYVLDAYGRMAPFSVGTNLMPRSIQPAKLFGKAKAVGVALRSNEKSGYVLGSDGSIKAFGGAASLGSSGVSDARAIVLVGNSAGYVVAKNGTLHAIGGAFGDPSHATIGSARAAAGI